MNLTVNILDTTGAALVADSISIDGTVTASASSAVEAVTNESSAEIIVQLSGYSDYVMTIDNVYLSDKTIDITLAPIINDIEDVNYLRPYPSLFTFNDPCSFNIDYYIASNYVGNTEWYINNELYKSAELKGIAAFNTPGDYQVKLRSQTSNQNGVALWDRQYATIATGNATSGTIDDLTTYLALDTDTNVIIVEYRVGISLEIEGETTPLLEGDSTYYTREEEITITPTITYTREGANPNEHTITWKVVDPLGLTVYEDVFPLDLIDQSISFVLQEIGVYTVTATVVDSICDNTFEYEIGVETGNFIHIEYQECGTFKVTNRSSDTSVSYKVTDIANSDFTPIEGVLNEQQIMSFTFTDNSIYTFDITYIRDDVEQKETYLFNNYCGIEKCFTEYIEDLLCAPADRCSPCPPDSDLKQMFFFYNTYFMKINKLFNTNSFFTALDEEGLSEITTLTQLMEKMTTYCARRSCMDSSTTSFGGGYQFDGPYDWTGKGSNKDKNCSSCN